jgi:hypothetical protein
MGAPVFVGIAIVVAIACHRWVRPFWLAVLVSGPIAAAGFQAFVAVDLGHVDPFFPIALAISTPVAWAMSLGVGLVMRVVRQGNAVSVRPPVGPQRGEVARVVGLRSTTTKPKE